MTIPARIGALLLCGVAALTLSACTTDAPAREAGEGTDLVGAVSISCSTPDGLTVAVYSVTRPAEGTPDFGPVWELSAHYPTCEATTEAPATSEAEVAAVGDGAESGHVYSRCASNEPTAPDVVGPVVLAPGQELTAAALLALCPDHPQASSWQG
ncbi:hypothetical protein LEP48_04275 [Isoptericola sp. NEAU-Y5]|uniref:Lipoprotein n=1 Tax=Isoptericola luteus TaxID=2879484 RepID=A0ABS7ZBZ0_9MICO|nr:hypothetical protein [Isoptericola sp. NEAU-Y5]MCA5892570.1 hypothetical protein [Isoptericola sp. NEAU-Y5]